ncbi:hypothetical protein TH5_17175 [Thalassospira xianhensis MCCC 1A02616]|uniref:Uncharacterized protein n=1 Tax=Thalassospira xianhensis MCCC 1A02616 TaxID=1177929 RepID=A0A367U9Y5_9PROT|nr:hypothetical protein TH5_17175 [Thalassospira xianhensis MCCC 1A02616]
MTLIGNSRVGRDGLEVICRLILVFGKFLKEIQERIPAKVGCFVWQDISILAALNMRAIAPHPDFGVRLGLAGHKSETYMWFRAKILRLALSVIFS